MKYEDSMLIAVPPSGNILETGGAVSDITFQLSNKVLTQKRKYTTLIDVLGDVGGLMKNIWTFLDILSSFILEMLYEKSLINNIFSFDIDKKTIILKKEGKNKIDLKDSKKEETLKINIDELKENNKILKNSTSKKKVYENRIFPYTKINEIKINKNTKEYKDIISKKTLNSKSIKKRDKKINIIKQNASQKNSEETKSKENFKINEFNVVDQKYSNYDNSNLVKSENLIKEKDSEEKGEKEKKNIIERIKFNKCCFCLLSKRKNISKILFEEATKIIIEKLDIMNLINKLYIMEIIKVKFNIEGKFIEMSDICRQDLENYKKTNLKFDIINS